MEGVWSTHSMPWPLRPEWSDLLWPPWHSNSWGHSQWVCKFPPLYQTGCQIWLLISYPPPWIQSPHNLQQSIWQILIPMPSIWSHLQTGHFPKRMDEILERCEGYIGIADNTIANGHTETEHAVHLFNLMKTAHMYGLAFSPQETIQRLNLWNPLDTGMMLWAWIQIQRR